MSKHLAATLTLLLLAFAVPQASAGNLPSEVDPAITSGAAGAHLNEARQTWLARDISRYSFSLRRSCFCPPQGSRTRVTVDGRKKTSSVADWFGPRSVPALFKFIHEAIQGEAAQLDVKYDSRRGFPISVWVDRDRSVADEEIGYLLSKFARLG